MPRGNQTGPEGMGPMTGRGAGNCAGYDMPGFANPANMRVRMGMRMGCGPGRGGYRVNMTMQPRGGRGGGYWGWGAQPLSPEENQEMLKARETWLERNLEAVRQQLGAAQESESTKKD